jgi:hypothetical protein
MAGEAWEILGVLRQGIEGTTPTTVSARTIWTTSTTSFASCFYASISSVNDKPLPA